MELKVMMELKVKGMGYCQICLREGRDGLGSGGHCQGGGGGHKVDSKKW